MEDKTLLLGIYLYFKGNRDPVKLAKNGIKGLNKSLLRDLGKKELEKAASSGIKILFKEEEGFPEALKNISSPPSFLYIKGTIKKMPLISVIGARKATSYGKEVTEFITRELVKNRVGIVSGLARGIDTIAHKTALSCNGYTIGILGCGIDVVYPPENRKLFEEIGEKGALISEFPMGTKPRRENFPRRNRLISGLSNGVLVIEAGEKSGTLITARWALNQGKEIFCVPGSIFSPLSRGTHLLLKEGAILVDSAQDILFYLGIETEKKASDLKQIQLIDDKLSQKEQRILQHLSQYPVHIDELINKAGIPGNEIFSILSELELMDVIEMLPGKFVKLKS